MQAEQNVHSLHHRVQKPISFSSNTSMAGRVEGMMLVHLRYATYWDVGRNIRSSHRGVCKHYVLVFAQFDMARLQEQPAKCAPIIALVIVLHILGILW